MRGLRSPNLVTNPSTIPTLSRHCDTEAMESASQLKNTPCLTHRRVNSSKAKYSLIILGLGLILHLSNVSGESSRTVRSSIIKPTRVSYGDIEKANKTCAPKDSCAPSRNDRNGAMMNDWRKRNCFCDQQCIVYEDCCVDSPYRRDPNVTYRKNEIFQCVELRQFGSLYMKTKCPTTWKDDMIRKGCEGNGTLYDPISSLPITNMKSGFTFKNYYCALCNNQTFNERMEMWKPRMECASIVNKKEITKEVIDNRLEYRPEEGSWGLTIELGGRNVWGACKIDPVIPDTAVHLVRFCKPVIKDCPAGYNVTDIHRKCLSYTAAVYNGREGYRNVHCAICNGIKIEELTCTSVTFARSGFGFEFNQAAFSFLFDLNPETGNEVGRVKKCSFEEIYDPFFQKCRAILCAPGQFYKDGQCITISVSTSKPVITESTSDTNELGEGNSDSNALDSNVLESTSLKDTSAVTPSSREEFEMCPKIILDRSEYEILDNGTVYILAYGKALSKRDYAVQSHDRLVVCSPEVRYYTEKFGATWGYLSFAGVLISVICLIIHLIACMIVPELRNLSGKNLASLCIALLVIYCVFLGLPFIQIPSNSCTIMAIILYYSFMAAFCWMLILAWDVAMTLRRATHELRVSSGAQWMRFSFYSVFGWLFPAILVTIAVVAEFLPAEIMPLPYSPNFGMHNCWFGQKPALLIYFAGPVGFILFLNVILFIDAARLIASTTQGTAKAKACGPSHKNFKLYLRLALLMGISWILGIVAGYVDIPALWIVFIIFNTLQGLFIFIAFTCTSKVRKALKAKLCCSSALPTASWTWSGIGGNQMARTTSSSSANTKRSDLEGRDSSESSHHSHHHHSNHHHNHSHGPVSLNGAGHHHSSLHSLGGVAGGKMYRSPSAELYRV